MDDEIIYSWCFNDVECFDSTPSTAIIILDKDLESFSSLRSQHKESFIHARIINDLDHVQLSSPNWPLKVCTDKWRKSLITPFVIFPLPWPSISSHLIP